MDKKRNELIDKSAMVFFRHGIRSVTMDDLARELGVSKKTLYNHFKDKDDLVNLIVTTLIERNQVACEVGRLKSETAIDALMNISEFSTRLFTQIHSSVFYDLQKYHPEAWDIIKQYRLEFISDQITQNIIRGQEEGIYIAELDPKIMTGIHLSIVSMLTDSDVFEAGTNEYGKLLEEIVLFQLRGIVNDKGRELMVEYMKNKKK
ncbi:MAG TPA: TetR/AcrR family transcriptional regulator [Brumimicrobium sp.]|nr:TetR/AcrR family transcriptional regulator [Brumimicrobium sp.]